MISRLHMPFIGKAIDRSKCDNLAPKCDNLASYRVSIRTVDVPKRKKKPPQACIASEAAAATIGIAADGRCASTCRLQC
jgi:hypothetical protein